MPSVVYQFVASGARDVTDAFRSVESAARAAAAATREADRAFGRYGRRGGGGDSGAPLVGGGYRTAPRPAPTSTGANAPAVRAAKATADKLISLEEYAAQRRIAIARRLEEQRLGLVRSSARAIERELDREERAHARGVQRRMSAIGGAVASVGSSIIGGAGAILGRGATMGGALVRDSWKTQDIANRVSVNARQAGQGFIDPTTLRKEFEGAALGAPGIKASDVGEAAKAYIDLTGDVNTARQSMSAFAQTALASGTAVQDVATAAAAIGEHFDIKTVDGMKTALAALAFQGKSGAIELADVAKQFQRLAAAGAAFGLPKGAEGVAKLGGLLQIARQGTGSARMAATAVENIFGGLTARGSKIPGLRLYDKKGQKRDPNEILADAIALAGGTDMQSKEKALLGLFKQQGIRGANPLIAAYRDAAKGRTGAEGQKAGRAAVLGVLEDMERKGASWSEMMKDAAMSQQTASAQLTNAWEKLTAAAGEELAPALLKAVKAMNEGGGLTPVITTIKALGEAAALAVDGLKTIGLLKPKEEGPFARLNRAKEELAAFDKERVTGPMSPEQEAKRAALVQAVADADDAAWQKPSGTKGKPLLTEAEFAQRYADMSGAEGKDKMGHLVAAKSLAHILATGKPGEARYDLAANDSVRGMFGENAAQRRLREDFQGQVTFQRTSGYAGPNDLDALKPLPPEMRGEKVDAAAFNSTVKDLGGVVRQLGAVVRPTIAGGTG